MLKGPSGALRQQRNCNYTLSVSSHRVGGNLGEMGLFDSYFNSPWYACQQVLFYKPVSVLPCHRLPYRPSSSEEAPFPRSCMLALRPCAVCCKHDLP